MTPSGLTRRKKNVLCSFGIVQRRSRIWLQWQNPGSRIQTRGNLVKTQIGKNHHDTKKSVINTPIWQKIENMVNHSHLPVRLPTPHNRHSYSKICMFYLHCNSICRHPNTTTSSAPQYYYILGTPILLHPPPPYPQFQSATWLSCEPPLSHSLGQMELPDPP